MLRNTNPYFFTMQAQERKCWQMQSVYPCLIRITFFCFRPYLRHIPSEESKELRRPFFVFLLMHPENFLQGVSWGHHSSLHLTTSCRIQLRNRKKKTRTRFEKGGKCRMCTPLLCPYQYRLWSTTVISRKISYSNVCGSPQNKCDRKPGMYPLLYYNQTRRRTV